MSWCLKTRCWDCGKLGHKRSDCPERKKTNQVIKSALKSPRSTEELNLVLCTTIDDIVIEQLIKESIFSAYRVAVGMYEKHSVKLVRFVVEVEKTKQKIIMGGNSKTGMCNVDGQSFHPILQELGLGLLGHTVSSQMTQLVFMMPSQ